MLHSCHVRLRCHSRGSNPVHCISATYVNFRRYHKNVPARLKHVDKRGPSDPEPSTSVQATDRSRGDKNPNQSGVSSAEPRSSLPGARKSGADNNMDRTTTMSRSSCLFRSAGALLPGIGIRGRRNGVRVWITRATVSDRRQLQAERKMDEYNKTMQRQMRNPYEYHHDLGMHFTRIADNLIVGSQPQSARDIDRLKEEESVTDILNLQQDRDIEYWGIDLPSITKRCRDLGIRHTRRPARDFDPLSLRKELPRAVSSLEWAISEGGIVCVHCTAGLGRAPAVAIAYLFWFNSDMDLNKAYRAVTSKRPCGPKRDAIRGATYDLAKNDPRQQAFEHLPEHAFTGVADWERKLIQDRVRALRGT